MTCHTDADGVAALSLQRLTPVHSGVGWEGGLNGAGRLVWDPPAKHTWLRSPSGGVSFHRPAAGFGSARQRDFFILEELRSVGSDDQRGGWWGDTRNGSERFKLFFVYMADQKY